MVGVARPAVLVCMEVSATRCRYHERCMACFEATRDVQLVGLGNSNGTCLASGSHTYHTVRWYHILGVSSRGDERSAAWYGVVRVDTGG